MVFSFCFRGLVCSSSFLPTVAHGPAPYFITGKIDIVDLNKSKLMMEKTKIGRNQPCPCGSGRKYKYCHMAFSREVPQAPDGNGFQMNSKRLELLNGFMHSLANTKIPLHEFCIDNDIYYFGYHSIAQDFEINQRFKTNSLTKQYLFECWMEMCGKEYFERMLKNDKNCGGLLSKRNGNVSEIVFAHFDGKYSLSIPASFSILEGVFREYEGVSFSRSDRANYLMDESNFNGRMLYGDEDCIKYFAKFLNKIMSGKTNENKFHRNTVLHGVNEGFATRENSMLLLMSIFEFSRLNNAYKLWPPKCTTVDGEYYINDMKVEMRTDW